MLPSSFKNPPHTLRLFSLCLMLSLSLSACDRFGAAKEEAASSPFVKTIHEHDDEHKPAMLLPDFAKLVEEVGDTVVNIQANNQSDDNNTPKNADDADSNASNDPFYEFFKRLQPNQPDLPDRKESEYNFGSGFIISPDGYILTNTHVLSGMNNIKVVLNDRREYKARLIGSDPQSDVALLKIDAKDLPVVKIGNVKNLRVGEWVAAIGAPFGFDNSVTTGIVSAKGRSLPNENYTPFIQTDVAINPGNSGGPLFNLQGQVVGINSQIYSQSGGFMGISFAIPIDVVMNVAEQLRTTGKVERGRLGVVIQEVSYDLAQSFGLNSATGALISQVLPNGPAAGAGLEAGDIVQSVNGEAVKSSSDLPVLVGMMPPGTEITLGIWRAGKTQDVKVKLGSSNEVSNDNTSPSKLSSANDGDSFSVNTAGLQLQPVNGGLLVLHTSGIALHSGIKRGDIILMVDRQMVNDEQSFKAALGDGKETLALLIQRGNNKLFVALDLTP